MRVAFMLFRIIATVIDFLSDFMKLIGHFMDLVYKGRMIDDPFRKQIAKMIKLMDRIAGAVKVFFCFLTICFKLLLVSVFPSVTSHHYRCNRQSVNKSCANSSRKSGGQRNRK